MNWKEEKAKEEAEFEAALRSRPLGWVAPEGSVTPPQESTRFTPNTYSLQQYWKGKKRKAK